LTNALRISVLFCILAFVAGGLLPGQATSARIFGNVQNEQGKFLAGVEVTAVNVGNNATTKVYTGFVKGAFNFLGLAPGTYQVSFDLPGYRSYVAAGIRLSADQSTTLRITLERLPGAEGAAPEEEAELDAPADLGPLKTWQVEFSAGVIANEPGVLNRIVYGDLEYSRNLPIDYYYKYMYSGLSISSLSGKPTGMLPTLGGLQPLTARLRFFLNRWLSLAAGIGWSERRVASAYSLTHDFFNAKADANQLPERFSVISEFPDYRLGVKMLFPHVGAQASQAMGRGLRVAEFVHAGWMFAECRFSSLKRVHDGLLEQVSTHELAMEGRGNGPALEGGFKLDVAVWRGLGAFVEASYLLSRVTRVTGKSVGADTVQDQKTLEILSSATEKREGRWRKSDEIYSRPAVWPDGGPAAGAPFTLDLGGPGVRAGLYFRF
jgi:hypothetical protein